MIAYMMPTEPTPLTALASRPDAPVLNGEEPTAFPPLSLLAWSLVLVILLAILALSRKS
jgi:hypothetical protein